MKQSPASLRFAIIATDVALFSVKDDVLVVRLISVNRAPEIKGTRGLPGGLIDPKETAEDAARRLVKAKAKIVTDRVYLEQLYTFSDIDRDPRGRVVAVAYLGLVPWEALSETEQKDTDEAQWIPAASVKGLAYDHDTMLKTALSRLRSRVSYTTLLTKLMPKEFTLTELETVYETILHTELDKRNFRKKILKLNILKELPKKKLLGRSRPAQLYRFVKGDVQDIAVL